MSDNRGSYANHPGHGTDCPCQLKVTPHSTGMSSRGYACRYTGGHCQPSDECEDRVNEMEQDEIEFEIGYYED